MTLHKTITNKARKVVIASKTDNGQYKTIEYDALEMEGAITIGERFSQDRLKMKIEDRD